MILSFKKFTRTFFPIFLGVFLLHAVLLWVFKSQIYNNPSILFNIYLFLLLLILSHFRGLQWLIKKWPTYAGLFFTGFSLFKMLFAIVYLFLLTSKYPEIKLTLALNFMFLYLLFLGVEVIFIIKNMVKNH